MVEPLMFFGLGFLVASLLALLVLPPVHARAERLTERRLRAELPLSPAQIRAQRDLLRAEFALSARRYEIEIEQLKAKLARRLAELGQKTMEIARLRLALGEETGALPADGARQGASADRLRSTENEPAIETPPHECPQPYRLADLVTLDPDFDKSPLVPHFEHKEPFERLPPHRHEQRAGERK